MRRRVRPQVVGRRCPGQGGARSVPCVRSLTVLLLLSACASPAARPAGGPAPEASAADPAPAPAPPALRLPDTVTLERAAVELWIDAERPDYRGESRFEVRLAEP